MILDAVDAQGDMRPPPDLCVVGAGPVGLAVAREAARAGRRIVILESGTTPGDAAADSLRARGIGGSSALWNTMYRGEAYAKLLPLDPLDFEPRDWIPDSGWPFGRAELDPWYRRAEALLGVGHTGLSVTSTTPLPFPTDSLSSGSYRFGSRRSLVPAIFPDLAQSSAVRVIQGATAVGMTSGTGGRIEAIEWSSLSGAKGTVRAATFVLAMGGIETPRFLLHTTAGSPWLGRGFMEHPADGSLELATSAAELCPEPGYYAAGEDSEGVRLGRLGLSEQLQRRERLPNAGLRFVQDEEPALLQSSTLLPAARRLVPFQGLRRVAGNLVRKMAALRKPSAARYRVFIDLEQGPDPENRITLSGQRDPLGVPQPVVKWRWREEDRSNLGRLQQVIAKEFERAGLGVVTQAPHTPFNSDTHHHLGATRMHRDPARGVVDERLRVHGCENLYLVGSSVFPAAGFANPTLTSVALAIRLAAELGN